MNKKICVLSGLVIPKNKISKEHFYPKSKLPTYLANDPYNIYSAHTTLNSIKSDLLPCEWHIMRWELTYKAIKTWNIGFNDKLFLEQTMKNWCQYTYNPCNLCLASIYPQFCKKNLQR